MFGAYLEVSLLILRSTASPKVLGHGSSILAKDFACESLKASVPGHHAYHVNPALRFMKRRPGKETASERSNKLGSACSLCIQLLPWPAFLGVSKPHDVIDHSGDSSSKASFDFEGTATAATVLPRCSATEQQQPTD